jgi:hypothetical protein
MEISMNFPETMAEKWNFIAKETARMSYPASMSRGKKPVVKAGTKAAVECFFSNNFNIQEVSCIKSSKEYNKWHYSITKNLASQISNHVHAHNETMSVAAKFVNTFMHQLTKYPQAHHIIKYLHLPLDARVFSKLRRVKYSSIKKYKNLLDRSPYLLKYRHHIRLQKQLEHLVNDLNARKNSQITIIRIELNCLWL